MYSHFEMYHLGKEHYQELLHQAEEIRRFSNVQEPKANWKFWFHRNLKTTRPKGFYKSLMGFFFTTP